MAWWDVFTFGNFQQKEKLIILLELFTQMVVKLIPVLHFGPSIKLFVQIVNQLFINQCIGPIVTLHQYYR